MFIFFEIILIIIALIFSTTLLVLLFKNKLFNIIFEKEEYIKKEEIRKPKEIIEDEDKIIFDYGNGETFTMPKNKK